MARRLSYIAVEGQHDAALTGRLLRDGGFALVQMKAALDPAFARFIPTDFPYKNDLLRRVPVPFFYQKADHAVALHPAGGDSELAARAVLAAPQVEGILDAIGFILDADDQGTPTARLMALENQIAVRSKNPGFALPELAGVVDAGPPRCGAYVMPDNGTSGTLEELLIDCAAANYPDLNAKSLAYLASIDRTALSEGERNKLATGSNEKKARLGVIGAVLQPCAAIANTISRDRWLSETARNTPHVAKFRTFLQILLNEPNL